MDITPQESQHSLGYMMVGEIRGTFWVPRYQRGYRWDTEDVQRLLDDIWNCKGQTYNLQPVVVKPQGNANHDIVKWELIDGQQRLTTLYLILHYMQRNGWKKMGAPYSILYETRPGSERYLKELDPGLSHQNIDYFHIYRAYQRIDEWFRSHGDEYAQEGVVTTFYSYLMKNVRVIWYEAPATEDSTALFTRLNVGRISLTDAELVKAELLSAVRTKSSFDRAQEFAAQWDGIERDLHDPDVWSFVSGKADDTGIEKYPTRISLLLDTLADSKAAPVGKRPRYYTFDTLKPEIVESPYRFWNRVVELHAVILGWFSDPSLYNKVGFLSFSGIPFRKVVALSLGRKKSAFKAGLVRVIADDIVKLPESKLMTLAYHRDADRAKLLQLLLLMNVETVSRMSQRFPFRRHAGKTWSLEHIHAQNAESLTTADQWKAWLEAHRQALLALPDKQAALMESIDAALSEMPSAKNFGDTFRSLAEKVTAVFEAPESGPKDEWLHSITNLALLSSRDNSSLSNAVFEVKRQKVLELDRNLEPSRDAYIPICTRNVFLKYYAGADAQQIHFWSPQDRESYYQAIISMIGDYLLPETVGEEEEYR